MIELYRSGHILLSNIVLIGTSLFNQAYGCYLDTVITKGLLLSYQDNQPYLLCPWDGDQLRCVAQSEQLMLMRHDLSYRQLLLSPPRASWQASSFRDNLKMILSVEPWGMVNGSLSLQWPLGEMSWTLSQSSRVRLEIRSRFLPDNNKVQGGEGDGY